MSCRLSSTDKTFIVEFESTFDPIFKAYGKEEFVPLYVKKQYSRQELLHIINTTRFIYNGASYCQTPAPTINKYDSIGSYTYTEDIPVGMSDSEDLDPQHVTWANEIIDYLDLNVGDVDPYEHEDEECNCDDCLASKDIVYNCYLAVFDL